MTRPSSVSDKSCHGSCLTPQSQAVPRCARMCPLWIFWDCRSRQCWLKIQPTLDPSTLQSVRSLYGKTGQNSLTIPAWNHRIGNLSFPRDLDGRFLAPTMSGKETQTTDWLRPEGCGLSNTQVCMALLTGARAGPDRSSISRAAGNIRYSKHIATQGNLASR